MGEKSTNYLESASAAKRMARDLPSTRLIFLLREPSSRALSNYLWSRMNGIEEESFRVALSLEDGRQRAYRDQLVFSRPFSYFDRGLYARDLRTWFRLFPREQVLVLTYEALVDQPENLLNEVHQFVGVQERGV